MSESKRTKYQTSDGDDRLSDLPQPILHKILWFLPPIDAIKTSLVSKTFLSAFNSFQVIDVDRSWFYKYSFPGEDEKFINYVNASIQRLKRGRIKLQKLSLRAQLADYKHVMRIKRVINSVMRNRGIEELNIDLVSRRYSLPPRTIMSGVSSSIVTLKLAGLKVSNLNDLDMISSWPLLENLYISNCDGLKHFKFSGRIIGSISLESCDGLKSVNIQSPSLQKFSYGWWHDSCSINAIGISSEVVDIDISQCQYLKALSLSRVQLSSNWLEDNVPKFVDLQNLELDFTCSHDSDNGISNQSLKRLVWDNIIYGRLIQAPKLQSLKLSPHYFNRAEMDIPHDMHHLRHLSCENKRSGISLDYFNEKLSRMVGFETLELQFDLYWKLTRFEINLPKSVGSPTSMDKTVEVKVHFPNHVLCMLRFCDLPKVVINSRGRLLDVTLVIDPDNEQRPHDHHYLVKLWSWIASFGRVKVLTLACSSLPEKIVIHGQESVSPNNLRVDLLSPIYDLSFLTLKLLSWKDISPELVDDILRQSPNLETLRFVTKGPEDRAIEFEYGSRIGEEDDLICCKLLSMKCWRHSLRKVALKNFDDIERHKLVKCFSESKALVI